MQFNRFMSALSAAALMLTTITGSITPAQHVHAEETSAPAVQTDMEITGNGGLGTLLANKLTAEQETLDAQNGCCICDVQLSGKQAVVSFDTTTDCTVLLTLFNDTGETLLTSAEAEVTAEEDTVTLDIADMPEYCSLQACLIDTETLAPISAVYQSSLYTQEMQEFLSKTTEDFDPDCVINLDDDTTKNFLVIGDNVVELLSDDIVNTAQFNETAHTVTLTNPDADASAIKAGDTVCMDTPEGAALFRAASVQVSNDSVVISAEEVQLEDVFAYINLDMDGSNVLTDSDEEQAETPSAEAADSTAPRIAPKQKADLQLPEYTYDESKVIQLPSFSFGDSTLTPDSHPSETAAKGTVNVTVTPSFHFYCSGKYIYTDLNMKLDFTLTDFLLIAKGRLEIPINTIQLKFGAKIGDDGVSGLGTVDRKKGVLEKALGYAKSGSAENAEIRLITISFGDSLVLNGEVIVQGTCSYSTTIGFSADSDGKFNIYNRKGTPAFDFSANGTFFVGFSIDYSVAVLSVPNIFIWNMAEKQSYDTFKVSQKFPNGLEFTVHPSMHLTNDTEKQPDALHLCKECYEGTVYFKSETVASLKSDIFPDIDTTKNNPPCRIFITSWHYSKDYDEFEKTLCPHHYYDLTLQLIDNQGFPVTDAWVSCDSPDAEYGTITYRSTKTLSPDQNGIVHMYLNCGKRNICIDHSVYDTQKFLFNMPNSPITMTVNAETGEFDYNSRGLSEDEYWGVPDEDGIVIADGVKYKIYDANVVVCGFTDSIMPETVLYAKVNGFPVKYIRAYAFEDCTRLTKMTISDSVTSIERQSFSGCTNLIGIIIPNSVTDIGNDAFRNCTSLTSITIPNSVTCIGDHVFSYCSSLTKMTIPNSVTSIGNFAFFYCTGLTEIKIPDSVTIIGDDAFGNCINLTAITIPNSVTSIGGYAFSYCSSLSEIVIPNSMMSISGYAFEYCTSLNYITIPDSVTNIGGSAFWGCSSLTKVTIPDSVTSIGYDAFTYTNLTDVYYTGTEEQWNSIDLSVSNNRNIFDVTIHYNSTAPVSVQNTNAAPALSSNAAVSAAEAPTVSTTREETALIALSPNSVYNIYALANRENGVSAGNLLYFAQAVSDADGKIAVQYSGSVIAVKAMYSLANAECSLENFTYDGAEKEAYPTVTVNGQTLTEGTDYLVSGSYTATDAGVYTILLEGTGDYFGERVLPYEITGEPESTVSVGDVNADGSINAKDANAILIAAAKIGTGNPTGLTAEKETAADVNGDGTINAKDANIVLRYAAAVGTGQKVSIKDFI